jgi:hypothetical protein
MSYYATASNDFSGSRVSNATSGVKSFRWALFSSIAAISSVIALVVTSSAAPLSGSGLGGELYGVSAISSSNVWAVGNHYISPSDIGDFKTVTEHLHGSTWSRVSSPSPPSYVAVLTAVVAVSATNVWAVGTYNATNGNDRTLIEHWKGAGWKIVPSPNPSQYGNALSGVSAASATDAWTVGYDGAPRTLAVHWNGSKWSKVKSPSPGGYAGSVLNAVSALSKSNVWAVGYYMTDGGPRVLIEHWTGGGWAKVAGRNPSGSDDELTGVSAVSPSNVWAVGYYNTRTGDKTLIEHWDGASWSKVPSPSVTSESSLAAVSALSSSDAWAVGSSGVSTVKTLIEHWNGTTWSRVPSPNRSNVENQLLSVSALTPSNVWAVGYSGSNSGHKALVEHWNGSAWSVK